MTAPREQLRRAARRVVRAEIPMFPPFQILVMRADGTRQRVLATGGRSPAWSPDGASIAYIVQRDVGPASFRSIFVMKADGTGPRRLTRTGSQEEDAPDWSPDSRRIAYVAEGRLLTIGGDGSRPAQLTAGLMRRVESASCLAFSSCFFTVRCSTSERLAGIRATPKLAFDIPRDGRRSP